MEGGSVVSQYDNGDDRGAVTGVSVHRYRAESEPDPFIGKLGAGASGKCAEHEPTPVSSARRRGAARSLLYALLYENR